MATTNTHTYAVVMHSSGEQAGYVVRSVYDGFCPAPYRDAARVAEYKREQAAQRHADRLNGYEV